MNEIISTVSNDSFKYVDDFIIALLNVEEIFYTYTTKDGKEKYPERVFAYELYHQFRNIMERKKEKYIGVFLNGEQTKSKEVEPELEKCAPDLVLHKSIYDVKPEEQIWLCEIKMKENKKAMSDLSKFNKMEKLGFPCYIFLYAGVTHNEMIEEICSIKLKINSKVFKKIVCISSYKKNGVIDIHCQKLEELYRFKAVTKK